MGNLTSDISRIPSRTLNLHVDFDGTGHLFCGRAGERKQEVFSIFPEAIADLTVRFADYMGRLYANSFYLGMVDIGVAITGVKGGVPYEDNSVFPFDYAPYDRADYRKSGRFSAAQMLDDPISLSEYLTMPFIKSLSQGRIDPFLGK